MKPLIIHFNINLSQISLLITFHKLNEISLLLIPNLHFLMKTNDSIKIDIKNLNKWGKGKTKRRNKLMDKSAIKCTKSVKIKVPPT